MKNKEVCIKNIIRLFYEFDAIFEKHKESNEAIKNMKSINEKIRSNKKSNFDLIEVPIEILMQKSNYLKGKLMKVNQDYKTALEFFFSSQKINIVCDASIIRKSIRQIIEIYQIMIDNINYDIDLIKTKNQILVTKASRDSEKELDKDEMIGKRIKDRDVFRLHIEKWNEQLNKIAFCNKDISVILNLTKSIKENEKKIDRAIKLSDYIYENFITGQDRFSLFLVSKSLNPVISLSHKNFKTYEFIKDGIHLVKNFIEENGYDKECDSNLIRSIVKTKEYLDKRSKVFLNYFRL
jgi:hypothetical protein